VSPETLADRTATGFCIDEYSSSALLDAIGRAVGDFADRKKWKQIMLTGMKQDWSWNRSASEYVKLYERALRKRADAMAAAGV